MTQAITGDMRSANKTRNRLLKQAKKDLRALQQSRQLYIDCGHEKAVEIYNVLISKAARLVGLLSVNEEEFS